MVVASHGRIIWNSDETSSNYKGDKPPEIVVDPLYDVTKERILHITHETVYKYDNPVSQSKHTLKLKPFADSKQRLISYSLDISIPCEIEKYVDVF
jgi:hypothetical protein